MPTRPTQRKGGKTGTREPDGATIPGREPGEDDIQGDLKTRTPRPTPEGRPGSELGRGQDPGGRQRKQHPAAGAAQQRHLGRSARARPGQGPAGARPGGRGTRGSPRARGCRRHLRGKRSSGRQRDVSPPEDERVRVVASTGDVDVSIRRKAIKLSRPRVGMI